MGTVFGYTAARMKEIEDSAIVEGNIVGNNLILTRHDGAVIDAGNVRGPQGIVGPPGGPKGDKGDKGDQGIQGIQGLKGDQGGLDKATLDLICPVGTIDGYGGTVAPSGWLLCDGAIYLRASFPNLFAVIGNIYTTPGQPAADGLHFYVPDLRKRVPLGNPVGWYMGTYAGSNDAQLVSHGHWHGHTQSHLHATWHAHDIGNDGNHNHIDASGGGLIWTIKVPGAQGNYIPAASKLLGGEGVTFTGISATGTHSHGGRTGVDATATGADSTSTNYDGTLTGVAPTDVNMQAFVTINYKIRY